MKNILIAEFKHETNTYAEGLTGLEAFQARNLLFGEEIISYFKGNKNEIAGFIDVLSGYNDVNIIPSVAANACPSGIVKTQVYTLVRDKIIETCTSNPKLDGILISFHGAMVLQNSDDCEGDLLEEIRAIVGPKIPIFISMDFHANVTQKMIKNATAMFPFDNYPHTDMYERGVEAAKKLYNTLIGTLTPVMHVKKLPILYPFIQTTKTPHQRFLQKALEYEEDPRVISVSVVSGFPYADIHEAGMSIIAQTNGEEELAESIVNALTDMIWNARHSLKMNLIDVPTAVEAAIGQKGSILLADVSDNPGNGNPGDATEILHELIKQNAQNCIYATIYDPETAAFAAQSGLGSIIHVVLGGKSSSVGGKPIIANAYVKSISDGVFPNKGIMSHGVVNHLGTTAVLVIGGIIVIVTSNRYQPWDPEVFRSNGIEPTEAEIIVLKSTMHYRAAFEPIVDRIIEVDAPNICPMNLKLLNPQNVRRPIYPLDEI